MSINQQPLRPSLLTRTEAARFLGVSPASLDRRRTEGQIPTVQVGPKGVRFDPADLDRYIDRNRA